MSPRDDEKAPKRPREAPARRLPSLSGMSDTRLRRPGRLAPLREIAAELVPASAALPRVVDAVWGAGPGSGAPATPPVGDLDRLVAALDRRIDAGPAAAAAIDVAAADLLLRLAAGSRNETRLPAEADPRGGPFARVRNRLLRLTDATDAASIDAVRRLGERFTDAALGLLAATRSETVSSVVAHAHDPAVALEYAATDEPAAARAALREGLKLGFARREAKARWRADRAVAAAFADCVTGVAGNRPGA